MRHLLCLVLIAGCAGSGTVAYHGSATVSAPAPDLVYVSPGVQVIADYDEPVFYTDGFYWRYYGGTWYRSRVYTGGWAYATPPRTLLRIDRPYAYVRYRPHGYVSRRTQRPVYRDDRPVIRDHRTPTYRTQPQQPYVRDHRSDDRPEVRDHRSDVRRDHRDDRRDERRDAREERREDRREEREERREDRRDRRR